MPNKINQSQIKATAPQVVVTNLSSADILALKATPIEVAPAPGSGKMIVPYLIIGAGHTTGLDPYTVGTAPVFTWGAENPFTVGFTVGGFLTESDDFTEFAGIDLTNGSLTADVENVPLMLANLGIGEYTDGTGTAKITVYYNIVSVS